MGQTTSSCARAADSVTALTCSWGDRQAAEKEDEAVVRAISFWATCAEDWRCQSGEFAYDIIHEVMSFAAGSDALRMREVSRQFMAAFVDSHADNPAQVRDHATEAAMVEYWRTVSTSPFHGFSSNEERAETKEDEGVTEGSQWPPRHEHETALEDPKSRARGIIFTSVLSGFTLTDTAAVTIDRRIRLNVRACGATLADFKLSGVSYGDLIPHSQRTLLPGASGSDSITPCTSLSVEPGAHKVTCGMQECACYFVNFHVQRPTLPAHAAECLWGLLEPEVSLVYVAASCNGGDALGTHRRVSVEFPEGKDLSDIVLVLASDGPIEWVLTPTASEHNSEGMTNTMHSNPECGFRAIVYGFPHNARDSLLPSSSIYEPMTLVRPSRQGMPMPTKKLLHLTNLPFFGTNVFRERSDVAPHYRSRWSIAAHESTMHDFRALFGGRVRPSVFLMPASGPSRRSRNVSIGEAIHFPPPLATRDSGYVVDARNPAAKYAALFVSMEFEAGVPPYELGLAAKYFNPADNASSGDKRKQR